MRSQKSVLIPTFASLLVGLAAVSAGAGCSSASTPAGGAPGSGTPGGGPGAGQNGDAGGGGTTAEDGGPTAGDDGGPSGPSGGEDGGASPNEDAATGGPVAIPPMWDSGCGPVTSVAVTIAGGVVTLAGTVRSWSTNAGNTAGEYGNGTLGANSGSVYSAQGISNAIQVSAGTQSTCVLLNNGTVQCMGDNQYGEIGTGQQSPETNPNITVPTTVTGITTATAIASSELGTCAILQSSSSVCWGDWSSSPNPTPAVNPGWATGVTDVAAGDYGSGDNEFCAVVSGAVKCLGTDTDGNLSPTFLQSGVLQVAVGHNFQCAVLSGGTAQCWGANDVGQLGNGTNTDADNPVTVTGLTGATAIAANGVAACAIVAGGEVMCWGSNQNGSLGNGSGQDSNVPVQAMGLTGVTSISMSVYTSFVCAISAGNLYCWGGNNQPGSSSANLVTPTLMNPSLCTTP